MILPIKQPHSQQQGFTILELLVVLLIVGVIVSMVTLSIGTSRDKVLREEMQRLTTLLELAQQESVLNMREMALQIDDEGYQFLVYEGENLVPAEGDVFRPRALPAGIAISAEVEGLEADEDLFGEPKPSQIWIYSSGELTPFSLTLELEDGPSYQLQGEIMGGLKLEGPLES